MTQEEQIARRKSAVESLSRLQSLQNEIERKYLDPPLRDSLVESCGRAVRKAFRKSLDLAVALTPAALGTPLEGWKIVRILAKSGLFDENYYRQHHPEIDGVAPLDHYRLIGRFKGASVSPLFAVDYYTARYPETITSNLDPVIHYLTVGWKKGYDPHPLFDTAYYTARYPEVKTSDLLPPVHYRTIGAKKGYNPHPLFDTEYYLANSPDLAGSDIDPLSHFLIWGAIAGRNPHPLFDIAYYRRQNPTDANPLIDYLQEPSFRKYDPHPLFDRTYYKKQISIDTNPLLHYKNEGYRLGLDPHPLFKTAFYREQLPEEMGETVDPLSDYLVNGVAAGRDPHPIFDSRYYLDRNPGVAREKINPLLDYCRGGAAEGRFAWSAARFDHPFLNGYRSGEIGFLLEGNPDFPDPKKEKIAVSCSSIGNYFMGEIADILAAGLSAIGVKTLRLSENDSLPADITQEIIVAPHEFFYLGNGVALGNDRSRITRSILVNVEQPQTAWFSKSYDFLRRAALVLDINWQTAVFTRALGLPSYFLPLGYLPGYAPFTWQKEKPDLPALRSVLQERWYSVESTDSPWSDRPIDLLFIGYLSQRRQDFFATNARWLHRYRAFFHIPPLTGPLIAGKGNALTTEAVIGLSQRSKILLNIHQSDLSYFEWHRIVFHGLWQKTLVITEPCYPLPGLIPNEHYIEIPAEKMEAKIDELLNTPAGREESERIRNAGHRAIIELFPLEAIASQLLSLTARVTDTAQEKERK